jgi:hypothetical protein
MDSAERNAHALVDSFFDEEGWNEQDVVTPDFSRAEVEEDWHLRFKESLYDWNDTTWNRQKRGKEACARIVLYKQRPNSKKRGDLIRSGYVALVSPSDFERLSWHADGTPKRWTVQFNREPKTGRASKVYARRSGRGEEPHSVYLHREVLGCLLTRFVVDHVNGWGLDNRRANLRSGSQSQNMANTRRARTKNTGLPVGVEIRKREGGIRYGGIRAQRTRGRKTAKIFRSKRTWKTPEAAARWYENQIKRRHGIRPWARHPKTLTFPRFPPEKQSGNRTRGETLELYADIPF